MLWVWSERGNRSKEWDCSDILLCGVGLRLRSGTKVCDESWNKASARCVASLCPAAPIDRLEVWAFSSRHGRRFRSSV